MDDREESEHKTVNSVQKNDNQLTEQLRSSLVELHEVLWARACVRVCTCECVFLYIMTGEDLVSVLIIWGGGTSHPLFIRTASLLTNLLSSRHSQDLNNPYAADSTGTRPKPKVCFTEGEKKVCSPFWGLCVCVCPPRELPSALLLANLCLVNPSRAPSHRDSHSAFCGLTALFTHPHTNTNEHTRTVKVVYQYTWMSLFAT